MKIKYALHNARSKETYSSSGSDFKKRSSNNCNKEDLSIKYAPDPNKQWFVLRATYNRISKAKEILDKEEIEYYLPTRHVVRIIKNKRKRTIEYLLPNFIFVYTAEERIKDFIKKGASNSFINYYYNHFKTDANGKNPPLTINYKEMMNFISLTCIDNEHIQLVDPKRCKLKNGDLVKIIKGDFKGIEGKVARVTGQQRVIIEIEGLCTIATAYIPTAFIQSISS